MYINDYRFDAWTNTDQPVDITDERHTIPASSPYVIQLLERPKKSTPTTTTMRVVDALAAAITTTTGTSITVDHGTWHAQNEIISIDNEQMQVTAAPSGNTQSGGHRPRIRRKRTVHGR